MRAYTAIGACLAACLFNITVHGQGRPQRAGTPDHKEQLSETYRGSKARDVEYQKIFHYLGPEGAAKALEHAA